MCMRFLVVIMLGVVPGDALADWQYTHWGMSLDQVAVASKGQLKRCNSQCAGHSTDTAVAQLFGVYRAGDFGFNAFALFDKRSGKLVTIMLNLVDPQRADFLVGSLRAKYGEPHSLSRSTIMELYVWRDTKDQISLISIGRGPTASVSLSYQLRLTESNRGL
jgi:hypothetical protein